jgi:hypothetical protein
MQRQGWCVVVFVVVAIMAWAVAAGAAPTYPDQAQRLVQTWLGRNQQPLKMALSPQVKDVQTFADASGPLYHVVYLNPAGLVVVAGEDLVEPIICFSPSGTFDPSASGLLGSILNRDVPGRVAFARQRQAQDPALAGPVPPALQTARRKWEASISPQFNKEANHLPGDPNDTYPYAFMVGPLAQTKWGQGNILNTSLLCYNYYTPDNCPCGCTATAMAQLMRCLKYPTDGIGLQTLYYTDHFVNVHWGDTKGGDGLGGPYNWDSMALAPDASTSDDVRRAIGALTWDAGLAAHSDYSPDGTGAGPLRTARAAMTDVFKFNNAKHGWAGLTGGLPLSVVYNMINPNLDFKHPVLVGLSPSGVGTGIPDHVVVCDGYCINWGTMYHHLNMGYDGQDNFWYNLPDVDLAQEERNLITALLYNVFEYAAGEIISGRVVDVNGAPLQGAIITITGPGTTKTATTNAQGIYAVTGLLSETTWGVSASYPGKVFYQSPVVTTGKSLDFTNSTGNRWGINFRAGFPVGWTPQYRLYSLSSQTLKVSTAYAINNKSQVAGSMRLDNATFSDRATIWAETVPGSEYYSWTPYYFTDVSGNAGESEFHSINDKGQAVGSTKDAFGNKHPCYGVYGGDILWQIQTVGNAEGQALGINNLSAVVGAGLFPGVDPPSSVFDPCYWAGLVGLPSRLSLGLGTSVAHANHINDVGAIVGVNKDHAVLWQVGKPIELSSTISEAMGISGNGTIVGFYTDGKGQQAPCIFTGGSVRPLDTKYGLQGIAYACNNNGQVVGSWGPYGRAFIWDEKKGIRDLNTLVDEPEWDLRAAYDINDKGEIVGWGWYKEMIPFAYVLRPITPVKVGVIPSIVNLLLGTEID